MGEELNPGYSSLCLMKALYSPLIDTVVLEIGLTDILLITLF
jgi:hypothetical protein